MIQFLIFLLGAPFCFRPITATPRMSALVQVPGPCLFAQQVQDTFKMTSLLNILVRGAIYIQNQFKIEYIMATHLEKTYEIQSPDKGESWPSAREYVEIVDGEPFHKAQNDYLPWDELRKKTWTEPDPKKLWWALKMARRHQSETTPVQDKEGGFYKLDTRRHLQFLHQVDLELGGNLLGIKGFSEGDKRQIIRRNLIEESFASSKLEGANTSREAARRLLNEGRKPRDKSERMIVNNHAAMQLIEENAKNQQMTLDLLLDLHRQVTKDTLASAELEGKLRNTFDKNGKRLVIKPWDDETIAYVTPDRAFIDEQLPHLIDFANDKDKSGFIHPLIKAIVIHFWLGLLHPFEDGNGRVARILFYWYMLKRGYWAFSYLSLSERILKSPGQYAMAYVNSEQDDHDLNYFIQYNVEKLKLAREDLRNFLNAKLTESRQRKKIAQGNHGLNVRQIQLLQSLHQEEASQTSVAIHLNFNPDIGYVTAVTDLKQLVAKGFLRKQKTGRKVVYLPTGKVSNLLGS